MTVYASMSYWDVYKLPIPFRKWLIRRYNKQQEIQNKNSPPPDEPLSQSERMKMIKQSQEMSNNPAKLASQLLSPIRNIK